MTPAPRLEMSSNGVEQFRFRSGLLGSGGAAEEAGAELGIPVNIVPAAHLIFEESRKQQTLCARRFQQQRIGEDVHVGHEIKYGESRSSWLRRA